MDIITHFHILKDKVKEKLNNTITIDELIKYGKNNKICKKVYSDTFNKIVEMYVSGELMLVNSKWVDEPESYEYSLYNLTKKPRFINKKNYNMEELLNFLKRQPTEVLHLIIFKLMMDEKISFTEITKLHVEYLELLKEGKTEKLIKLRCKVTDLWCSTKKGLPSKLVALIREAKDEGWANISEEDIEKSKWNK